MFILFLIVFNSSFQLREHRQDKNPFKAVAKKLENKKKENQRKRLIRRKTMTIGLQSIFLIRGCYDNIQDDLEEYGKVFSQTSLQEKWDSLNLQDQCQCPHITAYTVSDPAYYKYMRCCQSHPKLCHQKDKVHKRVWEWYDGLIKDLTGDCPKVGLWNSRGGSSTGNKNNVLYGGSWLTPPRGKTIEDITAVGTIWKFAALTSMINEKVAPFDPQDMGNYLLQLTVKDNIKGGFINVCSTQPAENEFIVLPGQCVRVRKSPVGDNRSVELETTYCPKKKSVFVYEFYP